MKLRPYQLEAVNACAQALRTDTKALIVVATGGGKGLIIAAICQRILERNPSWRILCLCYVQEILQSNHEACQSLGLNNSGIFCAGSGQRDKTSQIIHASRDSLGAKPSACGEFSVVIIDEGHLISSEPESRYQKIFTALNPRYTISLTATPFRLQGGFIYGKRKMFPPPCYEIGMETLVKQGFLVPFKFPTVPKLVDTTGIKLRNGEFDTQAVEQAVCDQGIIEQSLRVWHEHAKDRHCTLFFCHSVEHARRCEETFRSMFPGISTGYLDGTTNKRVRSTLIDDMKAGKVRAAFQCMTMTTGTNIPIIDCIVWLRPTMSAVLFVQGSGRGSRLFPEKIDCIAEGTLVLTYQGLVPIELVTREMLVWDGVSFVENEGAVFKGIREVISYAGLEATEDHKVWTQEGWKTFGECAKQQTPIAVTGFGGSCVQQVEGRFRRSCAEPATELENDLCSVRKSKTLKLHLCDKWKSRLQELFHNSSDCSKMASAALFTSKRQMRQQGKSWLQSLWWAWNKIYLFRAYCNGAMANGKYKNRTQPRSGQDRQRWQLRTWKPALFNKATKPKPHESKPMRGKDASVQDKLPTCPIRGCYFSWNVFKKNDARTDSRKMVSTINKTERKVWDILNCGPRNCFTAQGLLVHNCLVLDLVGNMERFGSLYKPNVPSVGKGKKMEFSEADLIAMGIDPKQMKGEAPTKECPACGTIVHAAAKKCDHCGKLFISLKDVFSTNAAHNEHEVIRAGITQSVTAAREACVIVTYTTKKGTFKEWILYEKPWEKERYQHRKSLLSTGAITHLRVEENPRNPNFPKLTPLVKKSSHSLSGG